MTVHADLLKPEYRRWRRFLSDSDSWSVEQIEAYQLSELQRIVAHAYEHTVGYREKYDAAGVKPSDLQDLEDIGWFPMVTKEEIRDDLEKFSVQLPNCRVVTTGGSTGIPLAFYWDEHSFARELASKAHQYQRIGWVEGDRQMILRGTHPKGLDHVEEMPELCELHCSSYHLTPESMRHYCDVAWNYRPDWLKCFPSGGYILASFLKSSGLKFPPLKGVLCASENLQHMQREILQEVFGGRLYCHYGQAELATLSGFCEHTDLYHVLPQYGYAEVVDSSEEPVAVGEQGEIIGTSFIMHATPFVRYRTRDFATLGDLGCKLCGRPYQLWNSVDGRLQDLVVTGEGRYFPIVAVNFHGDIFKDIFQFQFGQSEPGHLCFRFMPRISCDAAAVEHMRVRLMQKLPSDLTLTMLAVEDIPPTSHGKRLFFVQEMELTYGEV